MYVRVENITVKIPSTEYSSSFTKRFSPFSAVGDGLEGGEYGDDDDEKDECDLSGSTRGFEESGSRSEEIPCLTKSQDRKV